MALRVILLPCSISVASGAKRSNHLIVATLLENVRFSFYQAA